MRYTNSRKQNSGSFEEGQLLKACAGDNAPTQRITPHRMGILYPVGLPFAREYVNPFDLS